MESDKKIFMIIGIFIAVIIGVIFLSSMSGTVNTITDVSTATNEQLTLTGVCIDANNINESKEYQVNNAYVGDKAYKVNYGAECDITPTIINATGSVTLVDPADIIRYTDGTFHLVNSSNSIKICEAGKVNATYTYCADGYIKDQGSQTIAKLIIIMFALAILVVTIYPVIKEGIDFD